MTHPPAAATAMTHRPDGLTLLDDSDSDSDAPVVATERMKAAAPPSTHAGHAQSNASHDAPLPPYHEILQQATRWKTQVEGMRDEMYWLQVQNARSLDGLCMASGASLE